MKNTLAIGLLLIFAFQSKAQWVQSGGPSGHGGAVYSICTIDSTILAGTEAGVYRSTNQGKTWLLYKLHIQMPPSTPQPPVYNMAANGHVVYAAKLAMFAGAADGAEWTPLALPLPSGPTDVALNGSWIIAGTQGSRPYQSTDDGATWTLIDSTYGLRGCWIGDSIGIIRNGSAILRSSNSGASWLKDTSFGTPSVMRAISGFGNTVMLGLGNQIVISTDRGLHWDVDTVIPNIRSINAFLQGVQGPSELFDFAATDSGVFRSSDNGMTWTSKRNGLGSPLVLSLGRAQAGIGQAPVLLAGTGQGIYRSTDFGEQWTAIGVPAGNWTLAASDDIVLAGGNVGALNGSGKYGNSPGTSSADAYSSTDAGLTWNLSNSGLVFPNSLLRSVAATNPSGGYSLFAAEYFVGGGLGASALLGSSNGGSSWEKILVDSSGGGFPMVSAWAGNLLFGTEGDGLFRSPDGGTTWPVHDTTMIVESPPGTFFRAPFLVFCRDGDRWFAGGSVQRINSLVGPVVEYNTLFFSANQGGSWNAIAPGIPTERPFSFSPLDPVPLMTSLYANGVDLFVGTQGALRSNTTWPGGGVYHFVESGGQWLLVDSSLYLQQVSAIAGTGPALFAGVQGAGVFRSTDDGNAWTNISDGLLDSTVTSLALTSSHLLAATASGVWSRPLSEITSVGDTPAGRLIPGTFSLSQNFPNPFNPSTVINYQIPSGGKVTLMVYDILGREVRTLVNDRQSAGSHSVVFHGAGLSSGVYFYTLRAAGRSETKKLLLLK